MWSEGCKIASMKCFILVLSATVMAASLGAFFLYVAVVPIVTVSASVMALALSFALGAYVGRESTQADDVDQPAGASRDSSQSPRLALLGKSYVE